ncbi:Hypothetical predicted protein [Scomber scombrus]|uniref:Uncharacterized protein n=1 Tax=Scomber scombrus TaxID=13677 RepID=A0AAV1MY78_SCOSC
MNERIGRYCPVQISEQLCVVPCSPLKAVLKENKPFANIRRERGRVQEVENQITVSKAGNKTSEKFSSSKERLEYTVTGNKPFSPDLLCKGSMA